MSWYRVHFDMDRTAYMVSSPDFPELDAYGDFFEEAMVDARDRIEKAIAARISEGAPIPAPRPEPPEDSDYDDHIRLSTLILLKAALYSICQSQEVSRAELAHRLEWDTEQVDRLFRLDHNSRLDEFEAAFKAVGIDLSASVSIPAPEAAQL